MDAIKSVEDYRKTLLRINTLMNKGSHAISYAEMSEIRELRTLASNYEKERYDHSINLDAD